MNPFTRFLNQWSSSGDLKAFIEHWDRLEALAIHVYKQGTATSDEAKTYSEIKGWLDTNYGRWESKLEPFWSDSQVGGTLEHGDPFRYLFQYPDAEHFVQNWAALQHLPAAREALNQLLVELGEE
ncbi:MAG: hypothetical protein AAF633_11595 [Chloroflexota bacterium]